MTTKRHTLEAWVLHKHCSGDTSAKVSFFTREAGLVHCVCKGGRTPKKQALLQAFSPLWISIIERYDRYYAQAVESSSPSLILTGHALFAGLYINEILYYALSPNYPDAPLYDAYLFTLNNLAITKDKLLFEALLRRFEWIILRSCGYAFSLIEEAGSAHLIDVNSYYQFIAGEGFVPTTTGIPGAHILALAEDNLSEVAVLRSAKIIMRQAIDHLVGGREIKSRRLYSNYQLVFQ